MNARSLFKVFRRCFVVLSRIGISSLKIIVHIEFLNCSEEHEQSKTCERLFQFEKRCANETAIDKEGSKTGIRTGNTKSEFLETLYQFSDRNSASFFFEYGQCLYVIS